MALIPIARPFINNIKISAVVTVNTIITIMLLLLRLSVLLLRLVLLILLPLFRELPHFMPFFGLTTAYPFKKLRIGALSPSL